MKRHFALIFALLLPLMALSKPKLIWIDYANYARLTEKDGITAMLDKIVDVGFNTIVVDVTSDGGYAMFPSKVVPVAENVRGVNFNTDFDYLSYFIDQAHNRDLKVIVSTAMLLRGRIFNQDGLAYTQQWADKTTLEYTPEGFKDCKRPDSKKVGPFLSSFYPEVGDFLIETVREIASNYDIDGYALDYYRFCDYQSDFSPAARAAFEKYLGETIAAWPEDIFAYSGKGEVVPGKYYKQWYAFKAQTIHNLVERTSNAIHEVKPSCEVHYWAASWWQAIYGNGQNWASPNQVEAQNKWNWNGDWYSPEYAAQGFADHIDVFQLGSYLEDIYGQNNAVSIEFAINRGYELLGDDCKMYCTFMCNNPNFDIDGAIKLGLERTDGIMIFELGHIIKQNYWDAIKEAFEKYK